MNTDIQFAISQYANILIILGITIPINIEILFEITKIIGSRTESKKYERIRPTNNLFFVITAIILEVLALVLIFFVILYPKIINSIDRSERFLYIIYTLTINGILFFSFSIIDYARLAVGHLWPTLRKSILIFLAFMTILIIVTSISFYK